jgi:PAS domain S-box-containing protein
MMNNQGSPFSIPSFCRTLGIFFHKNGVGDFITFRESPSEFRPRYPETPVAGSKASSETVQRDQNPGRPVPVHRDREEKSMTPEDDLKVSELKYRRLFETAQDAILILDGDNGNITDANPFILELLGYPLDYFMGKHLWELGFFKDKILAQEAFTRLKADGYIRYEDLPLETRAGHSIAVEFVSNVYLVGDKKIIQCNIRDITARKRAEDALALANKKLNLLSSITRHDIVNKLNVLEAYFELSRPQAPNSRLQEFIGKEITTVKAIRQLINFAKDYEGMGIQSPAWQDVSSCIRSNIASLPLGNVKVIVNGPQTEVFADLLLQKVFYNLIDNALRYGGSALKTITFTSEKRDAGLVIAVEDDGVGISTEDKDHLFKRGFGKQTGLGLFLSREILSITGITVTENSLPGKGARFEITVPKDGYRLIKK